MSLFTSYSITCAQCGHLYTMEVVGSVNADRRPDLRQVIMDGTFQESVCPECGHTFRMEPSFTYLDVERGQWILSMPARDMPSYRSQVELAASLFEKSYGSAASPAAKEVGDLLTPRLTFGWPAIQEKLLIRDLELDDVVVEMMKLDLIRRVPEVPLRPGVEQRLVSMVDDNMRFQWLGSEDEAVLSGLTVGRELYDVIAADSGAWADIHELLTEGVYFVDMQKTYMADVPAETT